MIVFYILYSILYTTTHRIAPSTIVASRRTSSTISTNSGTPSTIVLLSYSVGSSKIVSARESYYSTIIIIAILIIVF